MKLINDNGIIRTEGEVVGDTITFHTEQDVEPIIERNKMLRDETTGISEEGNLYHIGSVPWNVINIWNQADGINFMQMDAKAQEKYLFRKLKDPDWAYLRTTDRGI